MNWNDWNAILEYCELCASACGIPLRDLLGESRKRDISTARMLIWCELVKMDLRLQWIAELFGRRSHSTIINGIARVRGLLDVGDETARRYRELIA